MKIAYIVTVNLSEPSGVLSKINQQIHEWTALGNEVYVLSFPLKPESKEKIHLIKDVKEYQIFDHPIAKRYFKNAVYNYGNRILNINKCCKYLETLKPDIIYLREMVAVPGFDKILKRNKVVLESNTLLEFELKGFNKVLYDLFQRNFYSNVNAFIGVTEEITNQFLKFDKLSCTITNGYEIKEIETNSPRNLRPQAIMVGSPGIPWHGMDKVEQLAELLPEIDFHIVGVKKEGVTLNNLYYHGYLNGQNVELLYKQMDIGLGTLALHRKGMNEACPLKCREYAAHGLPLIIGYKDLDFSGQPFVLEISNREDNIKEGLTEIKQFIADWHGKRIPFPVVDDLISIKKKEKSRIGFFRKVISK